MSSTLMLSMMLILFLIISIMSLGVNLNKNLSILYSRCFVISLMSSLFIAKTVIYTLFLDKGIIILGGLFIMSYINNTFNIFLILICLIIGLLTSYYPRKILLKEKLSIFNILFYNYIHNNKILNTMNEQYKILEYTLILLFIIIGGIFLMASNDLISLFLSIELQSYGLYILSSIYRNSESATSAGLTYFLLGSLSSCFILLGTSILYVNSGTTSLDGLYIISNLFEGFKVISPGNPDWWYYSYVYNPYYIHFSLIVVSIGFLFKISAAPFHFWSPDVYDGVPTIVTTFISIVAKITIFIFLFELVNNFSGNIYILNFEWKYIFVVSSLLSLIIGAVLGLTQTRIKRLLAYSSISHIGFILLVLSIKSIVSSQAFSFYLIQYTISSLNTFLILILIGYSLYYYVYKENNLDDKELHKKENNNSPIQLINQIKGYFYINSFLSLSLTITFFSFIGVPPLIGFFAKYMVLFASVNNGYIFMSIVAVLTSVISGVYYLVIIKKIFFENTDYILNSYLKNLNFFGVLKTNNTNVKTYFNINNIIISSPITLAVSVLTLVILLFIFISSELLNITTLLSLSYLY